MEDSGAVSVGVSCYTLVALSLERYFAICHPFMSRRWQTVSHARKMILGIWVLILTLMSPISAFQRLIRLRTGADACREIWPEVLLAHDVDKVYSVLLAVLLLLLPLLLMSAFYGLIAKRLWIDIMTTTSTDFPNGSRSSATASPALSHHAVDGFQDQRRALMLNSSRHNKDVRSRKRVIRMLFVIVLQYFLCWTPLYTLNTWQSIDFRSVYRHFSQTAWFFILLLAYTSSFIHPITYCFMNKNFRQGFLMVFRCDSRPRHNNHIALTTMTDP